MAIIITTVCLWLNVHLIRKPEVREDSCLKSVSAIRLSVSVFNLFFTPRPRVFAAEEAAGVYLKDDAFRSQVVPPDEVSVDVEDTHSPKQSALLLQRWWHSCRW